MHGCKGVSFDFVCCITPDACIVVCSVIVFFGVEGVFQDFFDELVFGFHFFGLVCIGYEE